MGHAGIIKAFSKAHGHLSDLNLTNFALDTKLQHTIAKL